MEIAVLITSCMRKSKVTWYQPQNMEAVKPFEISNTSTCTRCSKNGNQVPIMKLRPGNQRPDRSPVSGKQRTEPQEAGWPDARSVNRGRSGHHQDPMLRGLATTPGQESWQTLGRELACPRVWREGIGLPVTAAARLRTRLAGNRATSPRACEAQ